MGTAIPQSPLVLSSLLVAKPRSRTIDSSAKSFDSEVMVFLVRATGFSFLNFLLISSSLYPANRTFPDPLACAGTRSPTSTATLTLPTLSSLSTKQDRCSTENPQGYGVTAFRSDFAHHLENFCPFGSAEITTTHVKCIDANLIIFLVIIFFDKAVPFQCD